MLRLTDNFKQVKAELDKVRRNIKAGTKAAVQESAREAEERMDEYLDASVYDTIEGELYIRTGRASMSLSAQLRMLSETHFDLLLANTAPYGAQIELGNELDYFEQARAGTGTPLNVHVPVLSGHELATLMDNTAGMNQGDPAPRLFFSRSGRNYQDPGPHVTPAAAYSLYAFMRKMDTLWKANGAIF